MPVMTRDIDMRKFGRRDAPASAARNWSAAIAALDHAFQPIVNIHNGRCIGVEALLRSVEAAGFSSIAEVFDAAHGDGLLVDVDLALRDKALRKFRRISSSGRIRLFFNMDNRVIGADDYDPAATTALLAQHGLDPQSLCLELSERHGILDEAAMARVIAEYRRQGVAFAIDDFGVGHSGLRFLHQARPTLVKIDRFFVSDIDRDPRKRLIARHIVAAAHGLGVMVVAEGVETEAEFAACRDIACDYAQGFLIARPELDPDKLMDRYVAVEDMMGADRRRNRRVPGFVEDNLQIVEPVLDSAPLIAVLEAFKRQIDRTFLPVVDRSGWPVGIVREADLKVFTYSPFGRDLLANRTSRRLARDIMVPRPVADVTMDADSLLEVFTSDVNDQGILIARDMRYLGVLGAPALLRVVNETNLLNARDQNPLSRLPGNNRIYAYVSKAIEDAASEYVLVYVDFDCFKPFNDTYGFRQGDRIIVMFAELLGKMALRNDAFVGHIGGDDFFIGFRACGPAAAEAEVLALLADFGQNAESFYDPEARARGHIVAKDRYGVTRECPLLTASAVLVALAPGRRAISLDRLANVIAEAKHLSKTSPNHIAWAAIADNPDEDPN